MTKDLTEKRALVTGGTDGIGKEIARRLAALGARLIIVGRDVEKGVRAEQDIRAASGNDGVEFMSADFSLMRQTRRLADAVAQRWPAIDFLVHCAGVVRGRRVITSEGVESNFATNYLSRFLLTNRLLPALEAAGKPGEAARILAVSHPGFAGRIHYEDVNLTDGFSTIRAFRQFHFANDVFATELARRQSLAGAPPRVTIACLHPGPTKGTNIDAQMPPWMRLMVRRVVGPLFARAPSVPAATALGLLLDQEWEGETGALFSLVGRFRRLAPSAHVTDAAQGRRLWELSEALVGAALERPDRQSPDPRADRRGAAATPGDISTRAGAAPPIGH